MRQCVRCGKDFQPLSKVHAICSDECRRALRGHEYRTNRAKALHRDGYRCTECEGTNALECHHKKMLSQGGDNSLNNLQTLCQLHHRLEHRRMRLEVAIEDEADRRTEKRYYAIV
jgi:5-methylcytosine-specific restriction endonuclease McrA